LPGLSTEPDSPASHLKQLLIADGVVRDRAATLTPLSGGVSSEIYLVNDGGRQWVVKRALPKLKVEQEWFADVRRNHSEAAYIRYVGQFCPGNVPRLLCASADHGYFGMEYLGASFQNWKQTMLAGQCDPGIAVEAGRLLGKIHAHSADDPEARGCFQTLAEFEQLRIEPYLLFTGRRHPQLKNRFEAEAARLRRARSVLAHGDFSPKNILVSSGRIVLVDCEVAWYGDAAFDVAFLLCHLFLKAVARPAAGAWRAMVESAWSSYCASRFDSETACDELERDVSGLLLMLILARIDGKSPVEYLNEPQRNQVRKFAASRLQGGPMNLSEITDEWLAR